jgi:hypothetical protein
MDTKFDMDFSDISTDEILPHGIIFKSDITEPNNINPKSNFMVNTSESFYDGGIIENIYHHNTKENNIFDSDEPNENQLLFENFCDHNWAVGFIFMLHYYNIIIGQNSKNVCDMELNRITKSIDINILIAGNNHNGFLSGIYYFLFRSAISRKIKCLKNNTVNWLAVDLKNNAGYKCYNKLHEHLKKNRKDINNHIIHGYVNDDILDYKNFSHIKIAMTNHFNTTNIIHNNINPSPEKSKILILFAILSLHTLHKNGILLTKILEPEYWDTQFQDYILLLSLIFHTSHVFRFPICKNKKIYFQYYFIGYNKKKLLYKDVICGKLIHIYNNGQIKFTDDILHMDSIEQWRNKLVCVKNKYIDKIINPQETLYDIINNITEYI